MSMMMESCHLESSNMSLLVLLTSYPISIFAYEQISIVLLLRILLKIKLLHKI